MREIKEYKDIRAMLILLRNLIEKELIDINDHHFQIDIPQVITYILNMSSIIFHHRLY